MDPGQSAKKNTEKERVTSTLGGLEHQKLPHLILQVLIAIGIEGDVLPNHPGWFRKQFPQERCQFNLSETVLCSGITALDFHYNLRRTEFTEELLSGLRLLIPNVQLHMLRCFALKQILCKSTKAYGGIKLHIIEHYPDCIEQFGPPQLFDMIRYDHLHISLAKDVFKQTSKRFKNMSKAMLNKVSIIH